MSDKDRESGAKDSGGSPCRNDLGQFSVQISDDEFLNAIDRLGGDGATAEIARLADVNYQTAYKRLHQLAESGRLDKREIGNSLLWSRTQDGTDSEE